MRPTSSLMREARNGNRSRAIFVVVFKLRDLSDVHLTVAAAAGDKGGAKMEPR